MDTIEQISLANNSTDGAIRRRNKHRILAAAAKEFAVHGFKGTSVQAIADRVQLPKANVLYYFKSKTALYKALLNDIVSMWNDGWSEADGQLEPAQVIENYIREKMRYSRSNPLESKIFAMEIIQGAPLVRDVLEQPVVAWSHDKSNELKLWINQDKFPTIEPLYLLFMIWGTPQFYADFDTEISLLKGRQLNEREFTEAEDFTVSVILKGLGLIY